MRRRTWSGLSDRTTLSIETSSLHIDLISDLKRINSHICSIAYPILESAGRWRLLGWKVSSWEDRRVSFY